MDGLLDKESENASGAANNENAPQTPTDPSKQRKMRDFPADMTVEEFLNAERDRQIEDIKEHAKELVHTLEAEYEKLKSNFLAQIAQEADRKATEKTSSKLTINLVVQEGSYKDKVFTLVLEADKPAMIGRSRGKKFQAPAGISLARDQETSTTHGRFDISEAGTCTFTDVGSTNGSFLNEDLLEANVAVPFTEGDVLRVGSNYLKLESLTAS